MHTGAYTEERFESDEAEVWKGDVVIYAVEIKVNIEGGVDDALVALGALEGDVSRLQIWFAEDQNGLERGDLPLYDSHVIVRFRSSEGDEDDLTVKLRPCTEEQLVGRWSPGATTKPAGYRIEQDWSGDCHVLAASAVSKYPRATLLDAVKPEVDAAAALSADQREFLAACAPEVRIDRLLALGAISAAKYSKVPLGGLDANMERWTGAGQDFLEVSIKVEPKKDEIAEEFHSRVERNQKKLEKEVRDRDVRIAKLQDNKTKRMLTELARSVSHAPLPI